MSKTQPVQVIGLPDECWALPFEPPLKVRILFYRETGTDWSVSPHRHTVPQWYFCTHGRMEVTINRTKAILASEQSVLVPPLAVRSLRALGRALGYLVIIFESPGLDLVQAQGKVMTMAAAWRPDLNDLLSELLHPMGLASRPLCQALLSSLLIRHLRACGEEKKGGGGSTGSMDQARAVQAAEAFMQANLHRPLTRAEIAAAVYFSEVHLARLFRSLRKKTILQALNGLRLARAKALLMESTLSVAQVALEVGFSSFSHFSRLFRRQAGLPPSAYRRHGGKLWDGHL